MAPILLPPQPKPNSLSSPFSRALQIFKGWLVQALGVVLLLSGFGRPLLAQGLQLRVNPVDGVQEELAIHIQGKAGQPFVIFVSKDIGSIPLSYFLRGDPRKLQVDWPVLFLFGKTDAKGRYTYSFPLQGLKPGIALFFQGIAYGLNPLSIPSLSSRASFHSGKGMGGIRGRVVNEKGKPLANVSLSVVGDPLASVVSTNTQGGFFLLKSPFGNRTLRVDAGNALPKGRYGRSFYSVPVQDRKVSVIGDVQVFPSSQRSSLEVYCLTQGGVPMPGVQFKLRGSSIQGETDERGVLHLEGMPSGVQILDLDATRASPPSAFSMPMRVTLSPGVLLRLPSVLVPIPLDQTQIHGPATQTIRNPSYPGVSLSVIKDSVVFPKGYKGKSISLNYIPAHQLPVPMPSGQVSRTIFSIQPTGMVFKSPLPISFPNLDGFPPGKKTPILAMDLKTGKWLQIGTGTVSKNGKLIHSDGPVVRWASFTGCFCPGREGMIQGQVTWGGLPVNGAKVSSSKETVLTDSLGNYKIKTFVGCDPKQKRKVKLGVSFETPSALFYREKEIEMAPNGSKTLDFVFDDMKVRFLDDHNKQNRRLRTPLEIAKDGATSVLLDLNRPAKLKKIETGDRLRFSIKNPHLLDGEGLVVDLNPHSGPVPTQPKRTQVEVIAADFFKARSAASVAVRYFPPLVSRVGYQPVVLASYVRNGKVIHQSKVPLAKDLPLTVVGTPVCFIHGMNSSPQTWGRNFLETLEQQGIPSSINGNRAHSDVLAAVDYRDLSFSSLDRILPRLRAEISAVDQRYRHHRSLAHTKMDLVGHSYGGILARSYLLRLQNGKVPIRRVVTLGAPHLGASISDRVLNLTDSKVPGNAKFLSLWLAEIANPSLKKAILLRESSLFGDLAMQDLGGRNSLVSQGLGLKVPFFGIQGVPLGSQPYALGFLPLVGAGLEVPGSDGLVDRTSPTMGWDPDGKSFTNLALSHSQMPSSYQAALLAGGFLQRSPLVGGGVKEVLRTGMAPVITRISMLELDQKQTKSLQIQTRGLASSNNMLQWKYRVFLGLNSKEETKTISIPGSWIQGGRIDVPISFFQIPNYGFASDGWLGIKAGRRSPGNFVKVWGASSAVGRPQLNLALNGINVLAGGEVLLKGTKLAQALGNKKGYFAPQVFLQGKPLEVTFASPNQVKAKVPLDAETGQLELRTAGGFSNKVSVTVLPRILRVHPKAAFPGEIVVLDGGGLGRDSSKTQVFVGGKLQALLTSTTTRLSFAVVSGTLGGAVQVMVQGKASNKNLTLQVSKDQDADGLPDAWEILYSLDPLDPTDALLDPDLDGLTNGREFLAGTHPRKKDSDGGGLDDGFEVKKGLDPLDPKDDGADPDGDGLLNPIELQIGTNPFVADTDGDRLQDGTEYLGKNGYKTDPLVADTDRDLLTDGEEVLDYRTNPLLRDTDSDGLTDWEEVKTYKTDPLRQDTDGDTLSDYAEVKVYRSNPLKIDSDGDGLNDGLEVKLGTNLLNKDTDGDGFEDGFEYHLGADPKAKNAWTQFVGKVRRKGDGKPVAHAHVGVLGLPQGNPRFQTYTQQDGSFVFPKFPVFRNKERILAVGPLSLPQSLGRGVSSFVVPQPNQKTDFGWVEIRPFPKTLFPDPVYSVERYPASIAVGDMNGDGLLDAVTANAGKFSISVLLQKKSGGFVRQDLSVGREPRSVALGDVNGDGRLDVVTANDGGNSISVLLQNKSGGFVRQDLSVGGRPTSVALGDLNGDRRLDVVTANVGGNSISVLLQSKSGGFVRRDLSVGRVPGAVALGDLNGDRRLDVVTANVGGDSLSILLQGKSGGFVRKDLSVGRGPYSVAFGDVNGDGRLDLVAAISGGDKVTVLLQGKSGGMVLKNYSVGHDPRSVVIQDVNGDGRLDMVTANYGEDSVSVLLQNMSGGFVRRDSSVTPYPGAVALGDVNGDGRLDVVTVDSRGSTLGVLQQSKSGGFVREDLSVGQDPRSVALGDVNGDGLLDVVAANTSGNSISVLRQDKSGGFVRQDLSVGRYPRSVALGDVNGDGRLDVVTANSLVSSISILLQTKSGGFVRQDLSVWPSPLSVALGDVNGDGRLDVVTASNAFFGKISVLLQNKSGGFARKDFSAGRFPNFVALGDVNGDGRLDVVTADSGENKISVLQQTKSGGFVRQSVPVGRFPGSVALGDLNGDGRLDVVTANNSIYGDISVLLQRKSGGFVRQDIYVGANPGSVALGDVNGDGRVDVVTADSSGNSITVLLQSKSGGFASQAFLTGGSPFSVALGDMNHDGLLDFVTSCTVPTSISPSKGSVRIGLQNK